MIKDVGDDGDELHDSKFSKAAAVIFDKIDHRKDGFLPLSNIFWSN